MASLVLGTLGTAVGGTIGGPTGAAIGGFIGSTVGGMIDQKLFGPGDTILPDAVGNRLNDLQVQSSAYGGMIPILYGCARVAGNVIWARDIKEVEIRETQTSSGGKGGGPSASQDSVSFQYFATLAIAICEGPIDGVLRIRADSKIITLEDLQENSGKFEVHFGGEDQTPSTIIESYEGAGNVPAYRGIAYVVVEDFPMANFGNRIPNFTFEVEHQVRLSGQLEEKIKDITLIPGSGEFIYSQNIIDKFAQYSYDGSYFFQTGKKTKANMHNFDNVANITLALDQLEKALPNLESVAVVVNWFVTTSVVAAAAIIPKVEYDYAVGSTSPDVWSVAGLSREDAQTVNFFSDGTPTYGGTPTDASIVALCQELKNRGYNVILYPMPVVDTTAEMGGETDKPWRGRLTPLLESDVDTFFTRSSGYNDFIRHYSQLSVDGTALKDVIDGFIIGSELRGLTTFTPGLDSYPAVDHLKTLAANVQTDLGGTPLVIYAADWSEYHSWDGYYHLDPLWTDSNIDVVGIDSYFPLTPDLRQGQITEDVIKQYWEAGEGWDYYYNEDRTVQTSYDSDPTFAWKNVEHWWNSTHYNPGAVATGWTPKLKPIWFTEIGFPSVDGAANQPNVFVDASSVESLYPRGSRRRVDFLAQRDALKASLEFLEDRNLESGNSDLVPRRFVWTWDARPFPYWPDLRSVWADGKNWKTGHWINGKVGISSLGAIVADLLNRVGFTLADYDITHLTDLVPGFIIQGRGNVRAIISQLQAAFFFDMVESNGQLKFVKRGGESVVTIDQDDLVPQSSDGDIRTTVVITRVEETALPCRIDVSAFNRTTGYLISTQTSQRQTVEATDSVTINLPIVLDDQVAKKISDITLYNLWVGRTSYSFTMPPQFAYIEPTDIITLVINGVNHVVRITDTQIDRTGAIQARGIAENVTTYDFYIPPGEPTVPVTPGNTVPETRMEIMDLPAFPSDTDNLGTGRVGLASEGTNWMGGVIYRSDDGGELGGNTFVAMDQSSSETIMGNVLNEIGDLPATTWDDATEIQVSLLGGELFSASEIAILNGANACVCGNEIIQFQNAELVDSGVYNLSRLLRGRLGTEAETSNHAIGERFVFLDSAVLRQSIPLQFIGLEKFYKPVTIGAMVAETEEEAFTYRGNKFKPWSAVSITGTRDVSDNLTIDWIRRTRLGGEWRDGVDVPLSEETEAYEIDILDGVDVVRTLTSTTPTVAYSAAQQTADFGSPQSSIDIKIYQMSAIVGRGYPGIETI